MKESLGKYVPPVLTGDEELPKGARLSEFWRWAGHNLVVNTTRGALAEYLVALALDAVDGLQETWAPYDIKADEDLKIEVKSSAYLQSWPQKKQHVPDFGIASTEGWDPETGEYVEEIKRWSDVYVFCLLKPQEDKATLDPLNVAQWKFYVVSTATVNEVVPDQKKIRLGPLKKKLGAKEVAFDGIAAAVREAAASPQGQRLADGHSPVAH